MILRTFSDSNDENNFPHILLLTNTHRVATCPGIPGNPGKVLDFFLSCRNP